MERERERGLFVLEWPVGNLHGQVYHSPATPRPQRGLASFLYRNDILSTPRSDEGCRPVFNLSFLDDSVASNVDTDYPTQTRGSWKLGSPGFSSSRDVCPNSNGPNGQFESPSAHLDNACFYRVAVCQFQKDIWFIPRETLYPHC
ncbi:hypothetical protein ElyMa_005497000 [Elysia marginata]|uniref:Uncharacterized protein n=1 Tax=Elysia marginata TaxID=1093978 RepID=A0AAV4ETE8_9GAST|nr:hypothetical protein ElyMa_005497000 [Elysia marginata]